MRLEEWQRFIETQFLAEEPDAKPSPSEQEEASVPEVPLEIVVPEPPPLAARSADSEKTKSAEAVARRGVSPPEKNGGSVPPVFTPPDIEAIEIPSFERYLPPFRQVTSSKPAPQPPEEAQAEAVIAEIKVKSSAPFSAPSSARNKCAPGMSEREAAGADFPAPSADLWANVPRHIQTLLALEQQDEEEVAQNSYKRPFAEKRRELIERLLNPVLSLEDTARLLNVCPTTVRRYTNKGLLVCYRKEPERTAETEEMAEELLAKETRQRRFRLSDILAFLETQQDGMLETENKASRRRKRDPENGLPAGEEML